MCGGKVEPNRQRESSSKVIHSSNAYALLSLVEFALALDIVMFSLNDNTSCPWFCRCFEWSVFLCYSLANRIDRWLLAYCLVWCYSIVYSVLCSFLSFFLLIVIIIIFIS